MTPLTTYLNLCTQYYDLDKPTAPEDALVLYRHYAKKCSGKILEPMCGTGRFLLPLLEEGFDIEGSDASTHMLDALHTKAAIKNLSPKVWSGFLEDLSESSDDFSQYGLIFIPCGSICLITDMEAIKLCLRKIHNQLANDGLFVFEVETLKAVHTPTGLWRGNAHRRPDGKMILGSFLPLPLSEGVSTTICRYELIEDHQIIATEIEEFKVRLYEPEHMHSLLQEAGFSSIKMMKAFEQVKLPEPDNESIVFECGK